MGKLPAIGAKGKINYYKRRSLWDCKKNMALRPNILITGTPGVGKTTMAELAAEALGFRLVSVNDLVKEHSCHEGKDSEYDSYILGIFSYAVSIEL